MSGHHPRALLFAFLIFATVAGCSRIIGGGGGGDDWGYFNSFEFAQDTAGWRGYGHMQVDTRASPGGGRQSLWVGGACIHPHAYINIAGPWRDSRLVLRCWARNLAIGGSIELWRAQDFTKHLSIGVSDTIWTFYQSQDTLFCPERDSLRIEMSAGGFVSSAMLVDQLEIRRVR